VWQHTLGALEMVVSTSRERQRGPTATGAGACIDGSVRAVLICRPQAILASRAGLFRGAGPIHN
jgi:hypothetical protein